MAKLYAPRLVALAEQFQPQGIGFVGIDPNSQDSMTELAAYARIHKIPFPLLKDVGNRVADQMSAGRTPEVIVLDAKRCIRYRGRIDDQYGVGYIRAEPQRQDLKLALDQLLAGQPIQQPVTPVTGCLIGRVTETDESSSVTYANRIAGLLQRRCVECHRAGDIAPFALTEYDQASGWAEMIAEVVREGRMPPWHASPEFGRFANDRRLSAEERQAIFDWVAAGAPEGDPGDLPAPPSFVSGWQLPREAGPDCSHARPTVRGAGGRSRAVRILPRESGADRGSVDQAVEVLPGNRSVVHHILVFAESPQGGFNGTWQAGREGFWPVTCRESGALPFPEGMAKFLPAGSTLIFQMHYTPVGSVQEDLSRIGFVFVEPEHVRQEVQTRSAFQPYLRIPPNEADHLEKTRTRLPSPVQLLALMPHLHTRGKSFRYLSRLPEQDDWTVLLDVPAYDFNWQTAYRLAEPMPLPAGTEIKCEATYDNSPDNLNNPDPSETVRWGEQTWEEMLIGYFDVAFPVDPAKRRLGNARQAGQPEIVEELRLQLDRNEDDRLQLSEMPPPLQRRFAAADRNQDGVLSVEEIRWALRQRAARRR